MSEKAPARGEHSRTGARSVVGKRRSLASDQEATATGATFYLPNSVRSVIALQRTVGNQAVQRMLQLIQRVAAGEHKMVEDEPPVQRQMVLRIQRITPSFVAARPAPKRSNTDSSTTTVKEQAFTGKVTEDKSAGQYGYELETFQSNGEIQLVYYTEGHYPAPVPDDDSGALSNVSKTNWKAVADDLHANRTGIGGNWSAYLAEPLHENYHWNVEWVGALTPEIAKAETALKTVKADNKSPLNQVIVQTNAAVIVGNAVKAAKKTYKALGDSPGDPPYIAQAPAIDALEKRVRDEAAAKSW